MSLIESNRLSHERIWEPSFALRRRSQRLMKNGIINEINENILYFPIELNDHDYFRRLIDTLNNGLYDLVKDVFIKAKYDNNHLDKISQTILYEMLEKVNIGNQTIKICDVIAQNLNLSIPDRKKLNNSIEALLNRDKTLSKMIETHNLSSNGPIVDAFKLGKEILILCGGTLDSIAGLSSRISLALNEIKQLEDQRMLHKNYKEARLSVLGWSNNKKSDDSINDVVGSLVSSSEDSAMTILKQLKEFLSDDRKKSCIMLLHRLKAFSNDLLSLMTTFLSAEKPKEYDEMKRLKDFGSRFQEIVMDPILAKSYDDINSLQNSSLKIVSDLLREAEKIKFKDIEKAKKLDQLSREINQKSKELQHILADISLIDDNFLAKVNSEGTGFITPDYLFTAIHFDNYSIGSLLIKSGSSQIFESYKKIPGFTKVVDIEGNRGGSSLKKLFDHSIDSDDEVTEFEGSQTLFNKTNLSLGISAMNSPNSPTNYGSPSYTSRKLSVSFVSNSLSSTTNRRGSINSRTNSCYNYSRFDSQISSSNDSKFELAEDIYNQISAVLRPKALAHTQLINRMIGIVVDIHEIASLCDADDSSERDRLISISSSIENTIDADLDDCDVICSRGRKRIDLLTELKQKAERLIIALKKDAQQARKIETKNYSLAASLDSLIEGLTPMFEQLSASLNHFSFIDTSIEDMKQKLELEGTKFITSDFIFLLPDAYEGQSIASLAIIAGTGTVIRHIRNYWPDFTSLGVTSSSVFMQGLKASKDLSGEVDFSNAVTLRGMGFDPSLLLSAGFGACDIIAAGYSASELRDAGIDITVLKSAGLADTTSKIIGFDIDIQKEILMEFCKNMEYKQWLKHEGWDIVKSKNNQQQLPTATLVNVELGLRTIGLGEVSKQLNVISNLSKVVGLKINNNGCVIKIILPSNNLSGSLPNNIGYISTLIQIVLNSNKINGCIPESIGLLQNLEVLYLNDNLLEGNIPSSFKGLKSLRVLCLDNNKLSGVVPQSFASLRKLQRLTLNHNHFSGQLPYRLVELISLEELLLQNNRFQGPIPEFLGRMTNLKTLNLSHNYFSGPVPDTFTGLNRLTSLSLEGNSGVKVDMMTRIKLQRYLNTCKLKFDK